MKKAILPLVLALFLFVFNTQARNAFITAWKTSQLRHYITAFYRFSWYMMRQFKNHSPRLWRSLAILLGMILIQPGVPPANAMAFPALAHRVNTHEGSLAKEGYYGAAPASENFDEVTLTTGPGGTPYSGTGPGYSLSNSPRTISGWVFSLIDNTGANSPQSFTDVTNYTNSTHLADNNGDKALSMNGYFNIAVAGVIKPSSGEAFALTSFSIENGGASVPNYRVVGYLDGTEEVHQDFTAKQYNQTGPYTITLTDAKWKNIDEFHIVRQDGSADVSYYIDDIEVGSPSSAPTTINSINRASSNPTNATTVNYTVTFGAPVTGLTSNNFSLTAPGITGAAIGTITGSGTTYTVPVNTGTGDGVITLNLANSTGINPTISTTLPFGGQPYTIDKTAPALGIGAPSATTTTTGPVSYTVTYTDQNPGITSSLSTTDVTLNKTGMATGTVSVSGSGTSYTVTISGISGSGTLGISIAAGTAKDAAGNVAAASGASSAFNVTNAAPVAEPDNVNVTEDIPATGNVLSNDHDPEGDQMTASLVSAPVNGTIVLNADGSFTYTPNHDFSGLDSLIYQVCDNGTPSLCDTATLLFTVANAQDPPVIISNGGGSTASINVAENTTAVTTVTATDPDNDALTYSISDGADAGKFTIGSVTGVLSFATAPDFEKPADVDKDNNYEVSVQVSDGHQTVAQAITVTVTDVNETNPAAAFITTWKTTAANEKITIPINPNMPGSDYNVDWGDGHSSAHQTASATHTYANAGMHTVSITGSFPAIQFGGPNSDDANDARLITVEQWGKQVWSGMNRAFDGCKNLVTVSSTDIPIFAPSSTLYHMFSGCVSFNSDLNNWDLSPVRETSFMFSGASVFNGNISSWNVSHVTNMSFMFQGSTAFNGDISGWQTGSVTDMSSMFQDATSFNHDLNLWDVSKVILMTSMFQDATAFNGDISGWQPGSVTDMFNLFYGATSFNHDLNHWDVSKVQTMSSMFREATAFNGDLSGWQPVSATDMSSMFYDATAFNRDLSSWNVSKVQNMFSMFWGATAFNQDLSSWDVSKVQNMSSMFRNATAFNGDISGWHTGSVTDMSNMFYGATSFNRDLTSWDVFKVQNMSGMFGDASSFNQDLGSWNISGLTPNPGMSEMLNSSGLSTANYDATLMGWAAGQTIPAGITLGAQGLSYCAGDAARQALIKNHGWTITGDSKACALTVQPDANGILYVDSAVASPGDGSSWEKALPSFTTAIYAADSLNKLSGSSVKQIWVAKGTYQPDQDSSFFLLEHVKIYGSFAGDESTLSARPVFSGSQTVSILKGNGNSVVSNTEALDTTAVLDGFVITGGNTGTGNGGGIRNSNGSPFFRNLIIKGNSAHDGGGVYTANGAPLFVNVSIIGNNAVQAGGVYNANSNDTYFNVLVAGNTASGSGGGMYNFSGGEHHLINVTVAANKPTSIYFDNYAKLDLTNSIVFGSSNILTSPISLAASHSIIEGNTNTNDGNIDATGIKLSDIIVDSASGNYRLKDKSKAINAGTNLDIPSWDSIDLAGNPRIFDIAHGGIVDMGAYELQATTDSVRIIQQPNDSTVCSGADVSFSVEATGSSLSYQWQKSANKEDSWSDVNNGTAARLNLSSVQPADNGTRYRVIVGGALNKDTSASAVLHINLPPQITTQPQDATVDWQGTAQFGVTTAGQVSTYQWQSFADGTAWKNIAGATAAKLSLSGVMLSDSGTQYRVIVGNSCAEYTSSPATLHVNHPVLSLQPATLNNGFSGVGYSVTFKASGGTKPYVYQMTSGTLPTGLTFSGGLLSGTPRASGDYSFTVEATDASTDQGAPFSVSRNYTLKVLRSGSCITVTNWPVGQTVCEQGDASFAVSGTGITTYRWQSKEAKSGTWQNIAGASGATLDLNNVTLAQNGLQYRVVLGSGSCGSLTSQPVTLTVNPLPAIRTQPSDITTCASGDATFNVSATGEDLKYQWQSSAGGGLWKDISGATTANLSLTKVKAADNRTQYRVMVTSSCGNLTSDAATLTVRRQTVITTQPQDQTACENGEATFSVQAGGANLAYQWQRAADGKNWENVTGETGDVLRLSELTAAENGNSYRVIVSGTCQDVTSSAAQLTVHPISHTTLTKSICFGSAYQFGGKTISRTGTYTDSLHGATGCDSVVVLHLTVRSQVKTMLDQTICYGGVYPFGGKNISKAGTYYDTLSASTGCDSIVVLQLTVRPEIKTVLDESICAGDTYQVGHKQYSQTGTYYDTLRASTGCDSVVVLQLTVNAKTAITTQPVSASVCDGGDVSFEAKAVGTKLSYQWASSTDGKQWNPISGATSAALKLSGVSRAESGMQYRVMVSGACEKVTSDEVTLTVNEGTVIKKQPEDLTICEGEPVKLSVQASGAKLTYQWQQATDSGGWTNIEGADKATYQSTDITAADHETSYRVVVGGACETKTSAAAKVTVNPVPEITITADKSNPVSKGWPVKLTASGASQYRWGGSPDIQSGWDDAVVTIAPQADASYRVTGTTAAGCSSEQTYALKIVEDYKLICNNIVSPHKDGKNDTWIIQNISSYPNNEVMIYDRSGRMVYHKKGYDNRWNGMLNGGLLKEGTYYYVFLVDGGKKVFKGYIELLSARH